MIAWPITDSPPNGGVRGRPAVGDCQRPSLRYTNLRNEVLITRVGKRDRASGLMARAKHFEEMRLRSGATTTNAKWTVAI